MVLSVDVGGTFTDFIMIEEDISYYKVPSTPENPSISVVNGINGRKITGDIFHGTTVATNALLEGKGVKTAFITNRGFEDILFIGRQTRPDLYDLHVSKKKPPLEQGDCHGVSGRTDPHGEVIEKIDENEITDLARSLKQKGVCAAVCLLHSYKNPLHEEKIGDILEKYGVPHSLSCEVTGEYREYERGMTTLIDAYLKPIVKHYFDELSSSLPKTPLIMKSNGGLDTASKVEPVDTFLSGPAGGAAGGRFIAECTGIKNIVTFDMGGTSADMCSIVNGEISWKDQGTIGAFPVQSEMADIVTVGAGGGSIARKDSGGALRVGPQSAGADPGPVCYGKGGLQPTVTDALLCAGYIDPDYFVGGKMELNINKAQEKLEELADALDMTADETITGIYRIANSTMSRTMKKITVEKGLDPEKFSILAFGGAGPLHAASLADELGITQVIIPPLPGVFSAFGMMTGDLVRDETRTYFTRLTNKSEIEEVIQDIAPHYEGWEEEIILGLRYKGQSYHLNLTYTGDISDIESRFHKKHMDMYGFSKEGEIIEVVKVHVRSKKQTGIEILPHGYEDVEHPADRRCLFTEGRMKTRVYYRKGLQGDDNGIGPAVIEDSNSTILVPPSWRWRVDKDGLLYMEKEGDT
ncbi:MAG: hydantoinase/oxoprolinase family protein [Thermoplasmata archaeon]